MPSCIALPVIWKKPFKLCEEKRIFDQIEPIDKFFPTFSAPPTRYAEELIKKKYLYPEIKIVLPLVDPKKCYNFSVSYIRSYKNIHIAFQTTYQLNQDDYKFLKNYEQQLKVMNQTIFDGRLMRQVIIFLEKKAKVEGQLQLKQNWLLPFIRKRDKYVNVKKIELLLLSLWKKRRQTFIFPLYRPLWKNLNKQDLLFVYRPRGKKQVEKLTEVDEESMIEQLCDQIEKTSMICQDLRVRQSVKLTRIKQRIEQFQDWSKIYIFQREFNKIVTFGQLLTQIQTNEDRMEINSTRQSLSKYFDKNKDIQSDQSTCKNYQIVSTSLVLSNLGIEKSSLIDTIPKILVSNNSQQKSEDFQRPTNCLRNEKGKAKQQQAVSAYKSSQ